MKESQTTQLYNLLKSGRPIRTDEIAEKIYGGGSLARVGARIWDVKKRYGVNILGWHDRDNHALYWYRMSVAQPVPVMPPAFAPRKEEKVEANNSQSLF